MHHKAGRCAGRAALLAGLVQARRPPNSFSRPSGKSMYMTGVLLSSWTACPALTLKPNPTPKPRGS